MRPRSRSGADGSSPWPGLGVFGKLDRNQIVDQADEARRAVAALSRAMSRALFEVMVRHQQIDRRAPPPSRICAASARSRPASSAGAQPRATADLRSCRSRSPARRARRRRSRRRIARRRSRGSSADRAERAHRGKAGSRLGVRAGARHRRVRPGRCRSRSPRPARDSRRDRSSAIVASAGIMESQAALAAHVSLRRDDRRRPVRASRIREPHS